MTRPGRGAGSFISRDAVLGRFDRRDGVVGQFAHHKRLALEAFELGVMRRLRSPTDTRRSPGHGW